MVSVTSLLLLALVQGVSGATLSRSVRFSDGTWRADSAAFLESANPSDASRYIEEMEINGTRVNPNDTSNHIEKQEINATRVNSNDSSSHIEETEINGTRVNPDDSLNYSEKQEVNAKRVTLNDASSHIAEEGINGTRGNSNATSNYAEKQELNDIEKDGLKEARESADLVYPCFEPGCTEWKDANGKRIDAHGAGMLRSPQDNRWYWYGESSTRNTINCYSAESLAGPWTNHGEVFSHMQVMLEGCDGDCVVQRPKVIFNHKSEKFVMWFHADDIEFRIRQVGVATADKPWEPFVFSHTFLPDGLNSTDMSLFVDYDGRAYFVRSVNNKFFAISNVSENFMHTTGVISTGTGLISGPNACLEGFAMFRSPFNSEGKVFMLTSHCNYMLETPLSVLRSDGPDLSTPEWTDIGNPTGDQSSWNSQVAVVVQAEAENGDVFPVYIGDNWIHAGSRGLDDASYVWFPLRVLSDFTVSAAKLYAWSFREPWVQKHSYYRSPQCLFAGADTRTKCWLRVPGGCAMSLPDTTSPQTWFIAAKEDTPAKCVKRKLHLTMFCKSFAESLWMPSDEVQPCRPASYSRDGA
jgi:beta-galactosidase